jgi:DNA-binding response OmpR family regulator
LDDLELSLSNNILQCGNKTIQLGLKEFEIMRLLLSNPNIIVPKEDLLLKVWGAESDAEDNNVEVYISFLRKKLAYLNSTVNISTIRKVGYRLEVKE